MLLYDLEARGEALCSEDFGASALSCFRLDGLSLAELRGLDAGTWSPHSTLFLAARVEESVPADLAGELAALDRLVAGSCRHGQTGGDLERVVGPIPDTTDFARWAGRHAADDALYHQLCRLIPVDECGLMGTTALALELLAELAVARHDQATLIATELELIGMGLPRPRPFSTDRLGALGVDPARLITRALLQAPTQRSPRVPAGRLGRAIREAGLTATLLPQLESLATRTDLDTWNRFRAALAWEEAQRELTPPETVKARARTLALHPIAQAFLQHGH